MILYFRVLSRRISMHLWQRLRPFSVGVPQSMHKPASIRCCRFSRLFAPSGSYLLDRARSLCRHCLQRVCPASAQRTPHRMHYPSSLRLSASAFWDCAFLALYFNAFALQSGHVLRPSSASSPPHREHRPAAIQRCFLAAFLSHSRIAHSRHLCVPGSTGLLPPHIGHLSLRR